MDFWSASAKAAERVGALAGLGRGGRRMEGRQAALPAGLTLIKPRGRQATRIAKQSAISSGVMLDVEDLVPGPHYISGDQLAGARSQS